ncbi:MAG: hypothetical protein MK160_08975 [Rhodobacteraceae bacterium]|nr:hypothetical protein [Paracoccaceae bacterium]
MRLLPPLVFCALASVLEAEEFSLSTGDTVVPAQVLASRLSGQILTFYDNGTSKFFTDGLYTYTYAGQGGTAYGYWKVTADGTVCIDYINGWSRCDMYVRNGDRLVLITEQGDRFPIRPKD